MEGRLVRPGRLGAFSGLGGGVRCCCCVCRVLAVLEVVELELEEREGEDGPEVNQDEP